MKKHILSACFTVLLFCSCGSYNKILMSTDYENKYEAAKAYYVQGSYNKAATVLSDLIIVLKGTDKAQESLFMLGMCHYNMGDNETASIYFKQFYNSYPKGNLTEQARFYSGRALYNGTPEAKLDQTNTVQAIAELQSFLDHYPTSSLRDKAQSMIFELQDRLVEKEYLSAKLYYDLGSYFGNCTSGGSNYQACITTVQNTLREYPYTKLREDLYILNLRAKYELARQSVDERKDERYRDAIDEYYGFKNEFPESKYTKEADKMFASASKEVTIEEE
ncbi:MAG: outer membrane protein assembly factor BamD [Bacteroidaceae bacterium]|nr:outer membrane protein assembly factor BamD [Candidatus Minthousia equi]MCQ2245586.1 outer membrane protein assembly factor BamD [Bacteroidaceae bacterium]MDO4955404.1 outer membrane protein assembly factor BamD [Bacteroidales bacterium]